MLWIISFVVLLASTGVSAADDSSELIAIDKELRIAATDHAVVVQERLTYVAAAVEADGTTDAAVVAIRTDGSGERWRTVLGDPLRNEEFTALAVAGPRVCAAGAAEDDDSDGGLNLVVACFGRSDGKLLWERELEAPGNPSALFFVTAVRIGSSSLLIQAGNPDNPELLGFLGASLVYSLDLRDGS